MNFGVRVSLGLIALFICMVFFLRALHQDSSTPPLTQELYTFHAFTKTFGHCLFSCAAPFVWYFLPHEIRHIQSTTAVKAL